MNIIKFPTALYMLLVSITGIALNLFFSAATLFSTTHLYLKVMLAIFIIVINYYTILLPPKGNALSLDSVIYIAACYLLGLSVTLNILLISWLLYMLINRKLEWWKHTLNLSMYSIMIICSYYIYLTVGGNIGTYNSSDIIPTIIAFLSYFVINTILMVFYLVVFLTKDKAGSIISLMFRDSLALYLSDLLFSIILVATVSSLGLFGYFIFVSVLILLSIAFRQHFELYQKANKKANIDFLTGLSNHGFFKDTLEEKVKAATTLNRPLSLAILDIDDFKKYNDFYGHMQGDALLQFFGSFLETECKKHDYFVARYGGEEFTILMHNTPIKQATFFIDRLRKKLNDTYFDGVERLPYHCLSFSAGISEYKKDLYDSQELLKRADIAMYSAKEQGKNMIHIADDELVNSVQKTVSFEKELHEMEQKLSIFLSKDVYTYRHSKRVYKYAVDFSSELDLADAERKTFILGALVHDIGKLEIPRDIINKKGKLDPHEWEIMKKHTIWGKEIISTNKNFDDLLPIIELHHERFDGKGYPHGLKEYEIPKLARMLTVIDSFDAMTTERPYQKTKTFTEAIEELRACAGKQFDAQYVEPFINMIQKVYAVHLEMEQTVSEV